MDRALSTQTATRPAHDAPNSFPNPHRDVSRSRVVLTIILTAAFVLRLAWRVYKGNDDFWANGYSLFYDLATNVAQGKGFQVGGTWAWRMPLYPAFLALTSFFGKYYLWIVIPQALMGAGTAACAFLLGRDLFGVRTGLVAAGVTAIYPYSVIHDTALQDTCLFTFLTAVATWLLLRTARRDSIAAWTIAGLALAAAILTRQTLAPYLFVVLAWIGMFGVGTPRVRWRRFAVIALAAGIPVGCWIARNYAILGSPVMTSEFGRQLWNGNNANTFSHYPVESIDRSAEAAFAALTPAEQHELDALAGDEVEESRWFQRRGLAYIREHPVETLRGALRKVAAAFSWRFNPEREPPVQVVYFVSYAPLSILAMLGAWTSRRRWKELGPLYLHFLVFAALTAVFFGHVSHRAFLDVYMIVFGAAFLVSRLDAPGSLMADSTSR